MAQLGAKLRSVSGSGSDGIAHWCPGCNQMHVIWIALGNGRPAWTWNGDMVRPTFQPSVRCFSTYEKDSKAVIPNGGTRTICHYFITDGNIEYCADSPHALSGQRVPLPDVPEGW